jgi:hypothetical protein
MGQVSCNQRQVSFIGLCRLTNSAFLHRIEHDGALAIFLSMKPASTIHSMLNAWSSHGHTHNSQISDAALPGSYS